MEAERGEIPPVADEANREDQLSNADGRIEAVKKSAVELDDGPAKRTEVRQKEHSEFVTLTENEVWTRSNSASNREVVSLGLDGKSADISETVSMMDEVMT